MDLEKIQELLKLMDENDLEEIEIEDKGLKVRLKKESKVAAPVIVTPAVAAHPGGASSPASGGEADPAGGEAAEEDPGNCYTITSPMVGSFYRAPTPDGEPFVDVGDPVDADTVVCIVEAMKVMNEVKAELPGVVEKVFIENGRPVEYGQPLFVVAKS